MTGSPIQSAEESKVTADGKVTYLNKDQMLNKDETFITTLESRNLKNLYQQIVSSKVLDLKEAGGPFLPDSTIGIITLEIGGKSTTYYYLADADQRRDQNMIMKQSIAILDDSFRRLALRTIKRDDTLQKKIKDILKSKNKKK
jgi:hypothetical protein